MKSAPSVSSFDSEHADDLVADTISKPLDLDAFQKQLCTFVADKIKSYTVFWAIIMILMMTMMLAIGFIVLERFSSIMMVMMMITMMIIMRNPVSTRSI